MTSGRMYKDLCINVKGLCLARGEKPTKVDVTMFWSNESPSELSMGFRTEGQARVFWFIGRSLLIASAQEWSRDSWLGGRAWGGNVSVCYTRDRLMLTLSEPGNIATIVLPDSGVREFIDHTQRVVPPGAEEQAINMEHLDRELNRILG